ncbi:MAG: hypothetical protein EP149_04525 [Phascolarctobacterium sp.]|nr:hypothetical protein [Phascolarctobacterium sp.]
MGMQLGAANSFGEKADIETASNKFYYLLEAVFCKTVRFTNFTLILQNCANGFYFAGICYSHSQKTKNKS